MIHKTGLKTKYRAGQIETGTAIFSDPQDILIECTKTSNC